MKNLFKSFVVGALLLGSVGCSDMFKEDLYEINNEIDKINQRIDSLCNAVNTNIASLQTIIDVMQDNDYVDSITSIVENGVTIGYEIVFTQSGSVKIYHGEKGETGATGHSPVVGVKQAEDGRWYWTIDGEWMVNAEGKKILAEAIDGEDGAPGADGIPGIDGITPKLKVQDNYWYISYDNGTTWERLGKATGEAGADGDSMFQSVNYNEDYVELVLVDGTVLTIPTWASHMLLVDEIAKINNNISAIQAAVKALESNDYVQKVTPVEDKEGNVIGYTLQFAFTGDVTIYHGEDGEKGEDGHTPVIGVKQFNGEWYWTIDGEWLVDGNGEMVPTSGEDGAEGAEGQAGITPELKIEDDYWYISYDKGDNWTKLGKAKGEDGVDGGEGAAGDAFFEDVDTSDEYYIILTLADGTEIKIPTWKAHQALADAVSHLNTNVTSLQAIITGIQNNDFVTGTTEIVDPQTNEVIGYTLHFSKSGDIEIYHGKTPNAPEIGIRKHPQYGLCWTYDGEYIKDPSTGKPVALPQDGADAVAPKFKIEDGRWWMSTDGGRSWENIGQATGDQGQQGETGATGGAGDSFFKSVVPEYAKDDKGNVLKDELGRPIVAYIVMTLAGENEGEDVVYKVPTEYVTSELTKRIAAIEAQFTTISTIVNALQKAEYIKEVVELTEGLNVVGYEITFVKYTLNPDGTLSETIRKSTIRNGAGGAAGTVVDAEYDEKTGIWYWTLDGKPLIDEETGEVVPINGQAGVTPQMRINPETNFWEISYDNGNTWESTDVKATGPQGTPGQGGAAGDSFFVDVYKSSDGKFWIFERTEGEAIKVPTAEAFAALQNEVGLIKSNLNVIASAINGSKYITDFKERKDANGNVVGFDANLITYVLSYDETSGAYTFSTTDTEKIQYTANDVVTLIKKEDGYYWHIATGTSEDGTTSYIDVKVDGADWVPSVVLHADGNIYISKVSGHDESTLAADLAATGWEQYWIKIDTSKTTDTNTYSTVENILGKDGKTVVGYRITFAEGQVIEVPTKAGFDALVADVNGLKSNVLALNDFVNGNSYIADYEPIVENGKTVGFNANLVQYTITEGEDGNWVVSDPTKSPITFKYDCTVTVVNKGTEDVPVWEWVVNGEETGIPMEGWVPEVVLHTDNNIYISKVSGHDESTLAADIERGDWAKYWIQIDTSKTQDTNTFATVTGDEKTGYEITFADGTKISVPSMDQFASLVLEVRDLQNNIKALNSFVNSNSYITDYEPIMENGKPVGFKAKQVEYTLVKGEDGSYTTSISNTTPIEFKYDCMVTVVNKGTDTAPSWEWVVNGQETGIPMDGSDWVPAVVLHTDNNIYISKANGHDANTLVKDLTEDGWEQYWIKIDTSKTTDTFATVTGNENDGYTIEFPTGGKIKVPSYEQFQDVLDRLDAVESTVDAIQGSISTINGSLVSLSEKITALEGVQGNYLTSEAFQAWKDGARFVQNVTKDGDVWSFVVADGNGKAIEEAGFDITATPDVSTYEKDGVLYWVIKGEKTEYPVETKPKFRVTAGNLEFSFDGKEWTALESASNATVTVKFATAIAEDGTYTSCDAKDALWAGIYYSEDNIIWMPTYLNFKNIEGRLAKVEDDVLAIQGSITTINGSLESLSEQIAALEGLQGNYLTSEAFQAWKDGARFVQNVTKNGDVWSFVVADGNGNAIEGAGFDITATPDVSTYEKDGVLYWVINGKVTEYPVESKPKFRVAGSGNLEFSFDGKEWTALESASNATVTVKFATAIAEDGTYTSCDAKDALWAGIYYSEDNIIWMPTYKNFNELVAKVEAIDNSVDALIAIVEENAVITDITPSENGIGFTATAVKYELNYDEKGNLVKGTDGKYYKVTETTEITYADTAVSIEQDPETQKWYWVVNGARTELMGTGFVPQVHTADGYVYVSIAADATTDNLEKGWVKIAQNNTVVTYEGTAETGYTIDFGGGQGTITVPSIQMFNAVLERVSALVESVGTINTLLTTEFKQFVKSVEEIKSEGQLVGIKVVTAEYKNNAWEDKTSYYYDNALVVPKNDNGVWNWHIYQVVMKDDKGNFTYTELTTIPIDGTFVPQIKYESGAIYVSTPTSTSDLSTWQKLGNFADVQLGGTSQPTLNVTQDDTSVTFTFGSNNIQVAKYFQTPVITFTGTDGTLDLGKASEKPVTCEITGSFTEAPKVYAACEGHFTSSMGTVTKVSDTQYTVVITVKPTTAYVGDNMSGKLTVYCPYYGNTGIGQLNLTAEGSASLGVTAKEGNDTKVTIEVGSNETPGTGERLTVKAMHDDGTPVAWLHMGAPATKSDGKITQELKLDEYILAAEEASNASPRECTIAIYSPSGREVGRRRIVQNPIINLASKESANCYIISSPGRYMIPARKGNSKTDMIWGDTRPKNSDLKFDGTVTDNTTNDVSYVGMHGDNIIFDVNNASIVDGNTIIRMHDGTNTLWSWHLWFSPIGGSLINYLNKINDQEYNTKAVMMNRNIGAKGASLNDGMVAIGMYYQWGDKDPYFTPTGKTAAYYGDTPTGTWSSDDGSKTVTDPCPPGYQVPSTNVWMSESEWASTTAATLQTSYNFTYDAANPTVLYPYSTFLNTDNSLESTYTTNKVFHDDSFSYIAQGLQGQDRYSDITLEISLDANFGSLWASSNNSSLYYGFASVAWSDLSGAITIVKCKKEYRTRKISWTGITYGEWQDQGYVTGKDLSSTDKLQMLAALYEKGGVVSENLYLKRNDVDPKLGLQVRCVSSVSDPK